MVNITHDVKYKHFIQRGTNKKTYDVGKLYFMEVFVGCIRIKSL